MPARFGVVAFMIAWAGVAYGSGGLDPFYGDSGIATVTGGGQGSFHRAAFYPPGKIVGLLYTDPSDTPLRVYRADLDGKLDPSFGTGGFVAPLLPAGTGEALAVAADGKILIGGAAGVLTPGHWFVIRLLASGALDPTFGGDGLVTIDPTPPSLDMLTGIAVQADGKILVTGLAGSDAAIARLNDDGTLDAGYGLGGITTFDRGGSDRLDGHVRIQPDGRAVVGCSSFLTPNYTFCVARFDTDGTLDATFASAAGAFLSSIPGQVFDVALEPDGDVVVVGLIDPPGGKDHIGVVRLLPDGTPDAGFGTGGLVETTFADTFYEVPFRVDVLDDGRILVGVERQTSDYFMGLVRYASDGTLDTAFGIDGRLDVRVDDQSEVGDLLPLADGDVLVAGISYDLTAGGFVHPRRYFYAKVGPCGPCEVRAAGGACVSAPPAGCIRTTTDFRAKLQLRQGVGHKDKLQWTLTRAATTTAADFGNPTVDDRFVLCAYRGDAAKPVPLAQVGIPGGDTCGSRPCWKTLPTGFKRSSPILSTSGVRSVLLRSGSENRTKIMVKAQGQRLRLHNPTPLALPFAVRLQSTTGQCWESEFDADGVIANAVDRFKGLGD